MNHLLGESNSEFWCLAAPVSSAAGAVLMVDSLPDGSSVQGLLLGLLLRNPKSLGAYKYHS